MIILYTRSSSLNNWDYCEQQYFINYNLGIQPTANKKADLGTTTHKVLELLASCKKFLQDNPDAEEIEIEDDALGKLKYKTWDFWEVTELSDKDVDLINSTRGAKTTYKHDCKLDYGHQRFGIKVVEDLIKRSFEYYESKSDEEWLKIDFKNVTNWSWMPLEWSKGEYDPRRRSVFLPEANFDFEIREDWAYYHYINPMGDGKDQTGYYRIRGTIDLITKVDDNTLEIIDWKTGQRLNWATGKEKDFDALCQDKQLMLYYYAASKLFPEFKNIIFTIYFIRDGGPFTLCFDESHIEKMESILKEHFYEVQSCTKPKLLSTTQNDFRCNRLCHYYKNTMNGEKYNPRENTNICQDVHRMINKIGMEKTIVQLNTGKDIGKYKAPGT